MMLPQHGSCQPVKCPCGKKYPAFASPTSFHLLLTVLLMVLLLLLLLLLLLG